MSGIASIFIAAFALSALAPLNAFAGPCANQCQQKAQKEKASCDGEAARVKAADAARSASSAGKNTSPNQQTGATSLSGDTAAQKADTQSAANKCKQNEETCKSECDKEKGKIPSNKACKGDEGPIENTKSSICALIGAMAGELQQAANNLGGDNQAANNTKGNTGGMPPIPPIPPKDDKKDDKKATDDPTANKPMVCGSDSTTTRYSDCNDFYVNKCSGNMSQDGCDIFINRYCGPMNGGGSTGGTTNNTDSNFLTGTTRNPATANLVADKQGEGMGSSFCGKANGYRFCQSSGRESCPSCQNVSSWSTAYEPDQLKTAQNACPSDPIFSDPAIITKMNQGTSTTPKDPDKPSDLKTMSAGAKSLAGGGSSGSGGKAGSGSGGKATLGSDEGIAEGVATGPGSLDLNSGSGSGGGYHSGDEEKDEDSKHKFGLQSTTPGRTPAGNLVSTSSDVANQYGPNLFSISTSTYKALCVRGRFLHCRER